MKLLKSLLLFVHILLGVDAAMAQSSQLLNARDYGKKLYETKNKIVLDVRTKSEYDEGHLVNAMLIDYYQRDFKQQLSKLDKNKPVFVYCRVGGRADSAVEILSDLGFKTVYNLQGGILAWTKSNNPVVKE